MLIFAVETSCDETSVCILNEKKQILSHIIYSQSEHIKFGGVIPELASRAHLQILQKIAKNALIEAKVDIEDIDFFCATCGPGLIGGLLVGTTFTKGLAIGSNKPFIPINHLEGHLLSPSYNNDIKFPHISFLLTGGHTQIYLINSINEYKLLGETLDDAIGEAFDKVAKILGLPYPGGPVIEQKAKKGDAKKYRLPHPLEKRKDFDFSFSGIKTAINLIVKKEKINDQFISDIAASFQKTVTDILKFKLELLLKYLFKNNIKISQISLVGGVASNKYIYSELKKISKTNNCDIILPHKDMLNDNAAMIAWACIQKKPIKENSDIHFKSDPRLSIN